MNLPSYPEANENGPDREPASAGSRAGVVVAAVVVLLVAVMVILHLTGAVGPTAH